MMTFCYCFSQEIPVNKYDKSVNYKSFVENLNKVEHNYILILGYNQMQFLNSTTGLKVENGDIAFQYGLEAMIRKIIKKQFFIDVAYSYNVFKADVYTVANQGGEISAGVILIPFSKKLTAVFQPYAAIGYQGTLLKLMESPDEKFKKDQEDKATTTSAPIWKFGMMINLSKSFFINAQYKQSITSNLDRNFNCWGASLGFKL